MGSLLRTDATDDRGPSGALWGRLVDWVSGTLGVQGGCLDPEDMFPYNAGDFTLSGDSGSAATVSAVPYGVVSFAATAGTYAVAGYARNGYVDLSDIREVCREVRFSRTAGGTGSEISFIGFSDQAPEAIFHSDGTLDGGSGEDGIGLRWNNDLTVDLVSIVNSTATVLATGLFTSVSNTGFHKFGIRIKKENADRYSVISSVDGVAKKTSVAAASITGAAMRPVAVTTISATDAPVIVVDWDYTLDATPA